MRSHEYNDDKVDTYSIMLMIERELIVVARKIEK